ncbi:hypothetical protein QR680_018013 [Steinernema hermaphroditum]|uniref:Uncharacterized protein n=1 Tax=Steinernema hermaphroditum TaxID=289476 RepID=A0AA39LQ52_9BILA|nr:hypothetical protein QR680_018013 [Steinernema hermaphroditum]
MVVNIFFGLFFSISAAALFAMNVALFLVLVRHKEFSTSTYRIVKNMCVACMFQLFVFFVSGLMTLCHTTFNFYVERILGAVVQGGWMLYVGLSLTVAVDRLGIFICPSRTVIRDRTNVFLLCCSWMLGMTYFICLLSPGFGFTYHTPHGLYMWFYTDEPGSAVLEAVEPYVDFSCFAIELVIYSVVFVSLVRMRRASIVSTQSASLRVEMRLFCVAIISFIYENIFIIWFFWAAKIVGNTRYTEISVNALWLYDSGLFSFAMIVVNKSIRKKLRSMFSPNIKVATIILIRYKDFNTSTYRIIKNMCVACMFQLFVFFVGGLMTSFDSVFNFYVDRILGAVLQSSWMLYVGLSLTVAVDRLGIFYRPTHGVIKDRISIFLLCCSWILALAFLVCLLSPGFGFSYQSGDGLFLWFYTDEPNTAILSALEPYIDFTCFGVELVIYSIVFISLVKMRRTASHYSLKLEMRLFCVAITSFFYETAFIFWCFWATASPSRDRFVEISVNTLWLFDSGLFSFAMIVVNKSMRKKLRAMAWPKRKIVSVLSGPQRS